MEKLKEDIIQFFKRQNFVIVSTIDKDGSAHNSCKGILTIDNKDLIYLLDLYKGRTCANIEANSHISITAVEEHKFKGYCLKGKAKKMEKDKLSPALLKMWEDKISGRIAHRLIKNIHGEIGHDKHPESNLPEPEYCIIMRVEKIVDLTPKNIK
ncbi:MAG: pyridoxamine 5'-phosphate oxidase family protein [Candidatus Omnitrophota bacterium]